MGSRLQAVLVSLMAVVLLALGIPLGAGQARSVTQAAFVDRLNDTSRFASLAGDDDGLAAATAQDVGAAPPALAPQLRRYAEVYAVGVALVSRSGEVRAGAGGAEDVAVSAQPDVRARLQAALAGRRSEPPAAVLPWSDAPLVVAEPVVTGGDVVGAVLTVSPTSGVRRAVLRSWVVLGLAELAALLACVLLATGLTRWVLRPVRELDAAAGELATGHLGSRVPAGAGPVELRRLTTSFNHMAAGVEHAMEQQRAFVADASHELRNLLHALQLRLDDLAMSASGDAGWSDRVELAADEGRRLGEVLDRLLELARAEHEAAARGDLAGPAPGHDGSAGHDLVPVVRSRLAAWEPAAAARGTTHDLELRLRGRRTAPAAVDPMAVSVALDVLLDNAIRFGPPDARVHVLVHDDEAEVTVQVRDEGEGLAPDELRRAGDRFWRAPRHQNVEGSGLGLAIARTVLGRGDGRLEVAGAAEGGLAVRIVVPAA
ncbi:sensor histidine kinase [Angustibacter aerolatus]